MIAPDACVADLVQAVRRIVNKAGANKGKAFFCCGRQTSPACRSYFKWCEVLPTACLSSPFHPHLFRAQPRRTGCIPFKFSFCNIHQGGCACTGHGERGFSPIAISPECDCCSACTLTNRCVCILNGIFSAAELPRLNVCVGV